MAAGHASCARFCSDVWTDNVIASSQDASHAVRNYEDLKRTHNNTEADCQAAGISFIPIVLEAVGGGLGPAATKTLRELAKMKASASGESQSNTLSQLLMSLGIILHRENAKAILRRRAGFEDATSLLTAASDAQATS